MVPQCINVAPIVRQLARQCVNELRQCKMDWSSSENGVINQTNFFYFNIFKWKQKNKPYAINKNLWKVLQWANLFRVGLQLEIHFLKEVNEIKNK